MKEIYFRKIGVLLVLRAGIFIGVGIQLAYYNKTWFLEADVLCCAISIIKYPKKK